MPKVIPAAPLNVNLSVELRERARRIAKQRKTSTNQLIRDGLEKHLDELEARQIAEEKRRTEEKEARRPISGRVFGRLGESPLGPKRPTVAPEPEQKPEITINPLEETYRYHATLIAAAIESGGDPREKRLRVAEAVMAIKHLAPLTHPPDNAIVVELERRVIELRGTPPPAATPSVPAKNNPIFDAAMRLVDEVTGKTVPAVRTYGYVPDNDDDHRGDDE